jgi:hypothetical protein
MQKKLEYTTRKFLNKDGLEAIEIHIAQCEFMQHWIDAHVDITDYSNKVRVDLSVYDAKGLDAQMAKLQFLIKELTKVHDVFEQNYIPIKAGFIEESKKVKSKRKVDGVAHDEL